MAEKRKVLFLCTGNSCRSQMAEAILRHLGSVRFEAFSAGSHPAGFVHPLALEAMSRMNIPIEEHTSKSWDVFQDQFLDVVITVCDQAAGETCPVWPGEPITAYWPVPDPAFHPGDDQERLDFSLRVAQRLRTKIEGLLHLDWSTDRAAIIQRLTFLGDI